MGIFSGYGSDKGGKDKDPEGGRGSHKGGKSQISATSYEGKHAKDKGGKDSGKGGKK